MYSSSSSRSLTLPLSRFSKRISRVENSGSLSAPLYSTSKPPSVDLVQGVLLRIDHPQLNVERSMVRVHRNRSKNFTDATTVLSNGLRSQELFQGFLLSFLINGLSPQELLERVPTELLRVQSMFCVHRDCLKAFSKSCCVVPLIV